MKGTPNKTKNSSPASRRWQQKGTDESPCRGRSNSSHDWEGPLPGCHPLISKSRGTWSRATEDNQSSFPSVFWIILILVLQKHPNSLARVNVNILRPSWTYKCLWFQHSYYHQPYLLQGQTTEYGNRVYRGNICLMCNMMGGGNWEQKLASSGTFLRRSLVGWETTAQRTINERL